MILGIDKIHKLVREKSLVSYLSERELQNPEGAGMDLRLGELYKVSGEGFLGIDERRTANVKRIASFNTSKKQKVVLRPGVYYTMTTVEEVKTPPNVVILFYSRSTLYRSGIALFTGNCAPGYKGKLTFGIANLGKNPFQIELGARIAHAFFFEVKGKTNLYRGQWQGGRVATKKKEKQV